MSIVNEFSAKIVKYSIAEHAAIILDENDCKLTFKFTVLCKRPLQSHPCVIFFNTDSHQCLLISDFTHPLDSKNKYSCRVTRFWLENDLPVLSARLFEHQDKVMFDIAGQFSEQYASLILDGIINED